MPVEDIPAVQASISVATTGILVQEIKGEAIEKRD
jgi:hypothetical protein